MDTHKSLLLLLSLIMLLLQGCQTARNKPVAAQADGAKLYAENCAACHGVRGWGGVGVPLALNDFLKYSSDEFIAMTIRVGRPGRVMPRFWHLTEGEIQAIVGTVRSWGPPSPPYVDKPIVGDAAKGKRLFEVNCVSCHGNEAIGGAGTGRTFSRDRFMMVIPPALNNAGFQLSVTDEMLKRTITFGRAGSPMKSFRRKGLKRDDINHLIAYIRSFQKRLPPEPSVVVESSSVVMSVVSPYSMEETAQRLKTALDKKRWFIEEDEKTSPAKGSDQPYLESKTLYISQMATTRDALKIDPRLGLFLPAPITLMQTSEGKVTVMMANPTQFSTLFNNSSLNKVGEQMAASYQSILNEVVQ
jgi:cytochrome c oxidase cbb3-type subunit 3